jgi:hypothetical protein
MKHPRSKSSTGYERDDVKARYVIYAAGLLFACVALSGTLVAGLLTVFSDTRSSPPATALETTPLAPPLPRLEIDGKVDRLAVEADAERRLKGYAWVDRSAGTARIPIERAMQLLAARGWPDAAVGAPQP